jgi:hypothetical protein
MAFDVKNNSIKRVAATSCSSANLLKNEPQLRLALVTKRTWAYKRPKYEFPPAQLIHTMRTSDSIMIHCEFRPVQLQVLAPSEALQFGPIMKTNIPPL